MEIILNNESVELKAQSSILDMFETLEIKQLNGLALAIDGKVVPKSDWKKTILLANNKVVLITAAQGG